VVVTGATGFVGLHLCRDLVSRGAHVLAASRHQSLHLGEGRSAVPWTALDVSEREQCRALVERERPDVIFHLASHVSGSRESDLVLPMLHANLLGTVHLLGALQEVGTGRFVQVGSQEEPRTWADAPVSPYAAAKLGASAYCRLFAELYGVPVGVARVFMVYGPGPQDETKLVPYVITTLLRGRDPALMSGSRKVDWVYVGDVVEGLVRLAEGLADGCQTGRPAREVEIGTGVATPVHEVARALSRLIGGDARPRFGAVEDRAAELERVADLGVTERILGWVPEVELDRGLRQTVEWFRTTERDEFTVPQVR
jgi:nucleoside-diphosphate-sugar epimerase